MVSTSISRRREDPHRSNNITELNHNPLLTVSSIPNSSNRWCTGRCNPAIHPSCHHLHSIYTTIRWPAPPIIISCTITISSKRPQWPPPVHPLWLRSSPAEAFLLPSFIRHPLEHQRLALFRVPEEAEALAAEKIATLETWDCTMVDIPGLPD